MASGAAVDATPPEGREVCELVKLGDGGGGSRGGLPSCTNGGLARAVDVVRGSARDSEEGVDSAAASAVTTVVTVMAGRAVFMNDLSVSEPR